MRILLIDVYHYNKGGAETVCFNTGKLLEQAGHEVIYFTLKWNKNLPSPFENYFPESKETRKGLLRNFNNLINYFYYRDAAKKLEELIKDYRPELAHIHLMWGQISPSIFPILKKHHIPIVFTIHDYRIVCPAYAFRNGKGEICEACNGKSFYQCITNKCTKDSYFLSTIMASEQYFRNAFYNPAKYIDGLIYVSSFARSLHNKYMPSLQQKTNIILHNFAFHKNNEYEKQNTEKYFLFFGRLSVEKGLKTLIHAFNTLSNTKLKILGTGPLEDELKEMVISNNIQFLGYKSGEELECLVKNAYFTLCPSEWYENNPMSIIESYALGVPVIASNMGGIPEIIKEGKTGFVFESSNINDLITKIKKADKLSKEEYTTIVNESIKYSNENFNPNKYQERLIDFYNEILTKYRK